MNEKKRPSTIVVVSLLFSLSPSTPECIGHITQRLKKEKVWGKNKEMRLLGKVLLQFWLTEDTLLNQ